MLKCDELKDGVDRQIGADVEEDIEEMKSVVKRAYDASRRLSQPVKNQKGADKTVDKTEFHGFLIAFRWRVFDTVEGIV